MKVLLPPHEGMVTLAKHASVGKTEIILQTTRDAAEATDRIEIPVDAWEPPQLTGGNRRARRAEAATGRKEQVMGKRKQFTSAQITRFVTAARAADPIAVVEIVTDAGTIRILPESEPVADSPFDKWKATRNESEAQRN
ncbi:hypothetical protein [Phaeobacter inhibens]|uniref:hypothetical protein n=1 Tax=Phaeobacter inhibens TaxID=221822 RepID=UPI000F4BE885|nr:hypothetical protein [Phaeobacter inhibens]